MHDTLRGVVVTVAYEMCHGSNGVRCHERSEGGFIHSHISRAMDKERQQDNLKGK